MSLYGFNPSRESSSFTPSFNLRLNSYINSFQSLAGVIIIHAHKRYEGHACKDGVSIPRGSHHHSRAITTPPGTGAAQFQSLAGVIIIHAKLTGAGERYVNVSIPRGSHHHSRPVASRSLTISIGGFQSLAGVIIIHACGVRFTPPQAQRFNPSRESSSFTLMPAGAAEGEIMVSIPRGSHHHSRLLPELWRRLRLRFQSLAGVIIIHASGPAPPTSQPAGFNPSRESSSFTRIFHCLTTFYDSVSIPRGSHHHSRRRCNRPAECPDEFQSLAGVIIIHAVVGQAAVNAVNVSIPRGSHHHSRLRWCWALPPCSWRFNPSRESSSLTPGSNSHHSERQPSFNPSRESSSLTPNGAQADSGRSRNVSIPRGSHHHSRPEA